MFVCMCTSVCVCVFTTVHVCEDVHMLAAPDLQQTSQRGNWAVKMRPHMTRLQQGESVPSLCRQKDHYVKQQTPQSLRKITIRIVHSQAELWERVLLMVFLNLGPLHAQYLHNVLQRNHKP